MSPGDPTPIIRESRLHNHPHNDSTKARTMRSTRTAFYELIEGAAVYGFCITIPTLLGIAVKYYEVYVAHANQNTSSNSWISYYYDYFYSLAASALCNESFLLSNSAYCSPSYATGNDLRPAKRHFTDLQSVLLLSLGMACIRIAVMHYLVPEYLAPRQLKAIMRCKSSHVLSSASLRNFVSPVKGTQLQGRSISRAQGENGESTM